MSRWIVRFRLLNKRLLKKYSFWMILCLVPILVLGMRVASHEESGMACVAIYGENPQDELFVRIKRKLTEESSLVRYVFCEREEEAREMVTGGRADAAWIFPENLQKALEQAAAGEDVIPVMSMLVRENNVSLVLIREVLVSLLYPYYSYEVYRSFVRETCGLKELSDKELLESYHKAEMDDDLFQIVLLDSTKWEDEEYLLAPIRGMLALWLMLCALTAALYFMHDEREGVFDRIPMRERLWMSFVMQAVLLFDGGVILLATLMISGLFISWSVELPGTVLLAACVAALGNLLRLLCRTPERLGCGIPVMLLMMMVFCPIFISFYGWSAVKLLFPPYYYLTSMHDSRYMYGMTAYAAVTTGLCILVDRWQGRVRSE